MNISIGLSRSSGSSSAGGSLRNAQRGSALMFALIALVVLMIGSMALVHSVSTGSGILGNMGFKQDATASAERATRQAIAWLQANGNNLNQDNEANGYYATSMTGLDVTGSQISPSDSGYASRALINWEGNGCAYAGNGTFGLCKGASSESTIDNNKARYVITRLCLTAGDSTDTANSCLRPTNASASDASKRGALNYSDYVRFKGSSGPYYRIVARVVGARNTVSYIETIVHF